MTKEFDTLVYIGRFQPFHNGHLKTIQKAQELASRVVVIVGSANEPRTYKNPFTFEERASMIQKQIPWLDPVSIEPLDNSAYNDAAWASNVQSIVSKYEVMDEDSKTGIIGHKKDGSSYYLDMFPQWEFVDVPLVEPLDATEIRDKYFRTSGNMNWFDGVVPPTTKNFLIDFSQTDEFSQLIKEREFIKTYKKQYEQLPYPPVFVTVDAVVFHAGSVLMVKRRSEPGKGLLAFPGGFLNANSDKSIEDGMVRELKEETKIDVPDKVIRGSIKKTRVFDKIDRSERGRTITHAYHIVFDDFRVNRPKVKGSDDAEKAMWIPINEIKRSDCFEDHYDMLMHFLGR
jgi:bifunctional NMN adenylyltransferase/nudix hydrolase